VLAIEPYKEFGSCVVLANTPRCCTRDGAENPCTRSVHRAATAMPAKRWPKVRRNVTQARHMATVDAEQSFSQSPSSEQAGQNASGSAIKRTARRSVWAPPSRIWPRLPERGFIPMGTTSTKTTRNPLNEVCKDIHVERVVGQLNAICKNATFDFAMSVGKLIVESFYAGDIAAWRNRGNKDTSFRKLANHPDLPMSATALYRSTAIYELCERVGAGSWKHLSTSHVRLVLPLPMAQQARLLQRAEVNGWPVQRLREEIETLPSVMPCGHGGRRRRSRVGKALRALRPRLDALNTLLSSDDADAELSPESARSVVEIVQSVQRTCSVLEERAASRVQRAFATRASSFCDDDGKPEEN
jgi:hypothetical protein